MDEIYTKRIMSSTDSSVIARMLFAQANVTAPPRPEQPAPWKGRRPAIYSLDYIRSGAETVLALHRSDKKLACKIMPPADRLLVVCDKCARSGRHSLLEVVRISAFLHYHCFRRRTTSVLCLIISMVDEIDHSRVWGPGAA